MMLCIYLFIFDITTRFIVIINLAVFISEYEQKTYIYK